jgi:hypothetical protein
VPILLQLDNTTIPKSYPFKFNSQWILDKFFNSMIHKLWSDKKYLLEGDFQHHFVWKLKDLKTITKRWEKESRDRDLKVLGNLEENIKHHLQLLSEGSILP